MRHPHCITCLMRVMGKIFLRRVRESWYNTDTESERRTKYGADASSLPDWSGKFDIPMKTREYVLFYGEQVCEEV